MKTITVTRRNINRLDNVMVKAVRNLVSDCRKAKGDNCYHIFASPFDFCEHVNTVNYNDFSEAITKAFDKAIDGIDIKGFIKYHDSESHTAVFYRLCDDYRELKRLLNENLGLNIENDTAIRTTLVKVNGTDITKSRPPRFLCSDPDKSAIALRSVSCLINRNKERNIKMSAKLNYTKGYIFDDCNYRLFLGKKKCSCLDSNYAVINFYSMSGSYIKSMIIGDPDYRPDIDII